MKKQNLRIHVLHAHFQETLPLVDFSKRKNLALALTKSSSQFVYVFELIWIKKIKCNFEKSKMQKSHLFWYKLTPIVQSKNIIRLEKKLKTPSWIHFSRTLKFFQPRTNRTLVAVRFSKPNKYWTFIQTSQKTKPKSEILNSNFRTLNQVFSKPIGLIP